MKSGCATTLTAPCLALLEPLVRDGARKGRRERSNRERHEDGKEAARQDRRDRGRRRERGESAAEVCVARLMVQTPDLTQSRDLDLRACEDLEELRDVFFEEFHAVLKHLRPSQTLLFCLAAAESDADQMLWYLVTKQSDSGSGRGRGAENLLRASGTHE